MVCTGALTICRGGILTIPQASQKVPTAQRTPKRKQSVVRLSDGGPAGPLTRPIRWLAFVILAPVESVKPLGFRARMSGWSRWQGQCRLALQGGENTVAKTKHGLLLRKKERNTKRTENTCGRWSLIPVGPPRGGPGNMTGSGSWSRARVTISV